MAAHEVNPARRRLLLAGMGTILSPWLAQAKPQEPSFLSPASMADKHFFVRLSGRSAPESLNALPFRAHGLLLHPRHADRALLIARRPGTEAVQVELSTGKILQHWQAAQDRHFYGHACFSADGRTVFTTENDIDTGNGIVGVRDADSFAVLAEYPSYGIGPHELVMMPDGVTLAIANGGVKTFPETGRVKLNRGRIESSLAYIDSRTGKLLGNFPVPLPQLSLRHLAVAPNGQVAAAMQYQGEPDSAGQPLLVFHRGESELQVASAPPRLWDRLANYAASIAYDIRSKRYALSCPLGNVLSCWNADRSHAGEIEVPKVSGIAFGARQGFASNELGQLYCLDLSALTATLHASHPGLRWDNHLYLTSLNG